MFRSREKAKERQRLKEIAAEARFDELKWLLKDAKPAERTLDMYIPCDVILEGIL